MKLSRIWFGTAPRELRSAGRGVALALLVACGDDRQTLPAGAQTPTAAPPDEAGASPLPPGGLGGNPGEGPPPIAGLAGGAGVPSEPEPEARPPACTASAANASGHCFAPVVIGGGGFVSGLVASSSEPNLIYARTDVGGAYRWNQADESWVPLLDWVSEEEVGLLGIESLALDPNAPERLYLLAGIEYFNGGRTAVLSSDDYGASFRVTDVTAQFTAHGNGMGRQSGERLAVDPNAGDVLITGTRRDGLFRSADRGLTWSAVPGLEVTQTPNGNGIAFVLFDAASGTPGAATPHLWVGVSRAGEANLFESADGGETFSAVPGQPQTHAPQRAALAANGALYVSYGNGAGPFPTEADPMDRGELWKLDVASGAWTEITPLRGAQNRAFSGISVDANDPDRLLATTINTYLPQPWGYGDRLFLSADGGESWVDLIDAARVTMNTNGFPWIEQNAIHWAGSVLIDPFDPERAFVTSGNGIFMTKQLSAANATWDFAVEGLEEMVPLDAASVAGAPLISVVGDYDGFVHGDARLSPPLGRHAPAMGTTQGLAVAALAPEHVARVGNELYISDDGASTFRLVARPSADTGGQLAYSADGEVLLWSVGATTHRSADGGSSWAPVEGLEVAAAPEADAVDPSRFYAYDPDSGALFVSSDGGASFIPEAALPAGGARRIRAAPGVAGELWVALNGAGLVRSADAGGSFEPIAAVQSCRAVGFGAPREPGGFPAVYLWGAVGDGPRGLYRSDDAGATFLRINDDAHQYGGPGNGELVIGDANVYGRVYMSSAGRGLIMGEPVGAAR